MAALTAMPMSVIHRRSLIALEDLDSLATEKGWSTVRCLKGLLTVNALLGLLWFLGMGNFAIIIAAILTVAFVVWQLSEMRETLVSVFLLVALLVIGKLRKTFIKSVFPVGFLVKELRGRKQYCH